MDTNRDDGSLTNVSLLGALAQLSRRRICFACGRIRPVCGPAADSHGDSPLSDKGVPSQSMLQAGACKVLLASSRLRTSLGLTVTDEALVWDEALVSA